MIKRLDSSFFDWQRWRAGTLIELLNIPNRRYSILANRKKLIEHAVGWAPGNSLLCRPKSNCVAVMFVANGMTFWTHLFNDEFDKVFGR